MRVFMLIQHEHIRGPAGKQTADLVAALRSLGTTVVTRHWGRERDDEPLGSKVTNRFREVRSAVQAVRKQDFDVVVVNSSHDWRTLIRDLAVVLAIRRRAPAVVIQLHGSQSSRLVEPGHLAFKVATAALVALVDGLFVLSRQEQREWQAFRASPPVFTVKNAYVRTMNSHARDAIEASGGRPRVLFVGRLIKEKGVFDLVEAMPLVLKRAECTFVFVGEGEHAQELRNNIQHLGLAEHVQTPGYMVGSDLSREYIRATVLVLPSWSEGFATVLAEAMDAGLPIVTTRIRGAVDHLVEGKHALFVEPRDVKGLASAVVEVLRNPDLRLRMATANRDRIRLFDPHAVGSEYLTALKSLIRAPGEPGSARRGDRD
jgi:glycosyltransferase involved in cell wall biosynthesis